MTSRSAFRCAGGGPAVTHPSTDPAKSCLTYNYKYKTLLKNGKNFDGVSDTPHRENFMEIFTTLSVEIWFSTGTLGIFATLVYVFIIRVIIYDILSSAIIPTLSTSILFCNLCYILL